MCSSWKIQKNTDKLLSVAVAGRNIYKSLWPQTSKRLIGPPMNFIMCNLQFHHFDSPGNVTTNQAKNL